MAHSLNELLVSDMTLLWPASAAQSHNELYEVDVVPYKWENEMSHLNSATLKTSFSESVPPYDKNICHRSKVTPLSRLGQNCGCGVSTVITGEDYCDCTLQEREERCHCDENKQNSGFAASLWYNYCKSISDLRFEWLTRVSGDVLYKPATLPVASDEVASEAPRLLYGEKQIKAHFIHPHILPGFRYVVRQADAEKLMFNGRAQQLVSIGRGYGQRVTFQTESNLCNENYFYSDTHPAGYGLRVVAVQEGNKFTVKDGSNTTVGFVTVSEIAEQVEVSQIIRLNKQVEKRVRVSFKCTVDLFDGAELTEDCAVGRALIVRDTARDAARLVKISRCKLGAADAVYVLIPGINEAERPKLVFGDDIGDIPGTYIIKGLLAHELPVIGTFIHPDIIVGAKYKVRCLSTNRYLFDGLALKLVSIGKGYGKRITFQGESLLYNDNYFYSDTSEEGWGFTIAAVSVDDHFRILNDADEEVGRAVVFRSDVPQHHLETACSSTSTGQTRVAVTVTCHLSGPAWPDCTTTVTGEAVVQKSGSNVKVAVNRLIMGQPLQRLTQQEVLHMVPV